MFIRWILLCFLFFCHLYSDSFTINPIPITTSSTTFFTSSCYINNSSKTVFAWIDIDSGLPWYAIYDSSSKSFTTPAARIDSSHTSQSTPFIFCCYNSHDNQIVFSWSDNTGAPYYSIYDVTSGSVSTQQIDTGYTLRSQDSVFCCYNSQDNQIVFSWADNTGTPYCSIYNGNSFNTKQIDTGYTTAGLVFCCYNSRDNQIVFSWTDITDNHTPYCSIYNGITFTTQPIDLSYTQESGRSVFSCYNSRDNQIVFSWGEVTTDMNIPYCSIYDVTSGSVSTKQIDTYTQRSFRGFVVCSYNSKNNQVIFSWVGPSPLQETYLSPYYSIYNLENGIFNTHSILTPSYEFVFSTYNSINNQVIFSWGSAPEPIPYFGIYQSSNDQPNDQQNLLRAINLAEFKLLKLQPVFETYI